MVDLISFVESRSLRVCGILKCLVRVNPNSLFKMRIEAQSVAALSYRIVRTGLNKRQRRKESLNSSLCSLRFLLFDRIFLNSHLSRRSFTERGTTNHQLFPVARHFICNRGARPPAYGPLA